MKKKEFIWTLYFIVVCLLATNGYGQGKDDRIRPVTKTVALTNVMIVQTPDSEPILGNVVIKDGLIFSVGKNTKIPVDAKVLEGDSLYVYAGFIDGLSHTGVPKPKAEERNSRGRGSGPKPNDTGNPTPEKAGIQPDRTIAEVLKTDDSSIESMRKLGFTMSHSVPQGRMLPGQGAIVLLHGKDASEMIYKNDAAIFAQLKSASGVYPGTVIGVMSKFRELYKQSEQLMAYEKLYKENPSGMKRPVATPVHHAFYDVISGTKPIFFLADDVKSIHRIMTLKKDLGFSLILGGIKQGWHLTEQLKKSGTPIFLSLDLPADKKKKDAGKKEDKKESSDKKEQPVKEKMTTKGAAKDLEKEKLEARRAEEMKKHLEQASTFQNAGINFGFSTLGAKTSEIRKSLNKMIENGLSEKEALAALTTNPAKMLGLEAVAGTVEKGKLGNLVVTDKPYFEESSNVRYVLVEGEVFEYKVKKKSKGNANAKVDPSGTWSYSFEAAGRVMSGTITLKNDDGDLTGTISNPMTGQAGDIEEVSLNGNELNLTMTTEAQGQSITIVYDLVVAEKTMDGKVTAGAFGSFDVECERKSDPE